MPRSTEKRSSILRNEDIPVYHKVKEGNLSSIRTFEGGHRVLYHAACIGDVAVVKRILDTTQDLINRPNEMMHDSTALMAACLNTHEHMEIVSLLLNRGADSTMHSSKAVWGNTAFHWAVWRGAEGPLNLLLGNNPCGCNLLDAEGFTPLKKLQMLKSTKTFDKDIPENLQRHDHGDCEKRRSRIELYLQCCSTYQGHKSRPVQDIHWHRPPNILQLIEGNARRDLQPWKEFLNRFATDLLEIDSTRTIQMLQGEIKRLESIIHDYELQSKTNQEGSRSEDQNARIKDLERQNRDLEEKLAFSRSECNRRVTPETSAQMQSKDYRHDSLDMTKNETEEEYIQRLREAWNSSYGPSRAALNPSLVSLSKNLYSSPLHFVEEMIQNADDSFTSIRHNHGLIRECCIVIKDKYICFANNGEEISPQGVLAICSVGDSSKKRGGLDGKIGHKGLGWKSLFAATDSPFVMSGKFSFGFRKGRDNVESFLTPWWESDWHANQSPEMKASFMNTIEHLKTERSDSFKTFIFIPVHGATFAKSVSTRVEEIFVREGSILLLKNLDAITVLDMSQGEGREAIVECTIRKSCTEKIEENVPEVNDVISRLAGIDSSSSEERLHVSKLCYECWTTSSNFAGKNDILTEDWWMVRAQMHLLEKSFNSTHCAHEKRPSEIVICFPVSKSKPQTFNVHAFLPVEGCRTGGGLTFLLHADWNLTSSRDSIEEDDVGWNKTLQTASAEIFAFIVSQSMDKVPSAQLQKSLWMEDRARRMLEHFIATINRSQSSALSQWWRSFFAKIKRLVTARSVCFQISEEKEKELRDIFPSYREDLNLIAVPDQDSGLPRLDILELLSRYQADIFDQHFDDAEWWSKLFGAIKDCILESKCDQAMREKIAAIYETKPILKIVGSQCRESFSSDREIYLIWTSECLQPILLPEHKLITYESEAEKECLILLDRWKEATTEEIVRMIILDHCNMGDQRSKIDLVGSIRFLQANHEALFKELFRRFARNGEVHAHASSADPSDLPAFCIPINRGIELSSNAFISSFASERNGADSSENLQCVCQEMFEGLSDLNKVLMVIFLLQLGCRIAENVSESSEIFLNYSDSVKDALQSFMMDSVPSVRGESSALELLRTLQKNEETGRFFAGLQAVYANLQAASQVTVL